MKDVVLRMRRLEPREGERGDYLGNIISAIFFAIIFLGGMAASIYHGLNARSWKGHFALGIVCGLLVVSFLMKARKCCDYKDD
jgi:MFS family permease